MNRNISVVTLLEDTWLNFGHQCNSLFPAHTNIIFYVWRLICMKHINFLNCSVCENLMCGDLTSVKWMLQHDVLCRMAQWMCTQYRRASMCALWSQWAVRDWEWRLHSLPFLHKDMLPSLPPTRYNRGSTHCDSSVKVGSKNVSQLGWQCWLCTKPCALPGQGL